MVRKNTPSVRRNYSLRKKPCYLDSKRWQLNPIDRLSKLPDSILHHIIYFLGFRDACRTCILSKTWGYISNTNPIMDLSQVIFSEKPHLGNWFDAMLKVDDFLLYTEFRMRRYSKYNFRIDKLTLRFPIVQLKFPNTKKMVADKVVEWVETAVRNHATEITISGPARCEFPDILYTATSLRCLDCSYLEIPTYRNTAWNFPLLESLFFNEAYFDERTFNKIIVACPLLKTLRLYNCFGVSDIPESVVIPCSSRVESLDFGKSVSKDRTLTIDTSSLTSFLYSGNPYHSGSAWPVISKDGVFRNLRILKIDLVSITDEVLDKLLSELIILVSLKLCNCSMLKNIMISSAVLKEFRLENCADLLNVSVDAPCLKKFKYKGGFKPTVCINSQVGCDVSLHILPSDFSSGSFSKLKQLLKGLSNCDVLKILLLEKRDQDEFEDIEFDEELADSHLGLGPPCDIRELKLTLSSWVLNRASVSAFLDGVFWTCHPLIFSFRVNLSASNETIEPLICKLKDMANCWRHPLRRVEVEGSNCSNLLEARKFDVQLRLQWHAA